jgi:hypothetical protein
MKRKKRSMSRATPERDAGAEVGEGSALERDTEAPEPPKSDDAGEDTSQEDASPDAEGGDEAPPSPRPARRTARASFARRHATPIVLVAAVVGAGGYMLWDSGSLTTSEAEARKHQLMPAWRLDEITKVDVTVGDVTYTLTRPSQEEKSRPWTLRDPGGMVPAEEQVVDKLLTVFQYARVERKVEVRPGERGQFGLDAPRARFTFTMGKLELVVKVGGGAEGGSYVEVEGHGLFVVADSTIKGMLMDPADLRSRAFVPYLSTALVGLQLDGKGGKRHFERAPWTGGRGSGFRFAAGSEGAPGARVDGGRLDQVLISFGRMQAETFLDEATAKSASKPSVTVTMIPREGARGVLEVGGACPGREGLVVVVRKEPTWLAACVPEGVVPALERPAAEFEDDGVMGAVADEVIELSITRGDKALEIARFDTGFKVRKPSERQISAEQGNDLLFDLQNARGKPVPESTELAEPTTTVKIRSQGGASVEGKVPERLEELVVGAPDGDRVVVLRREDGQKLALDRATAALFAPSDLLLRDTTILAYAPINLEELVVERGDKRQVLRRSGPGFTLVEPKARGVVADEPFALEAFNGLAGLTASRWIAEAPESLHGLDQPRLVVKGKIVEGDGAERLVELLVGARSDEGFYASVSVPREEGQPPIDGVFLLPFERVGAFSRSFASREAFSLQLAKADRVDIRLDGKSLELVRAGRQLTLSGGSSARASTVEKVLGELSALRAVAIGPPPAKLGFDAPGLELVVTPRKGSGDDSGGAKVTFQFGHVDSVDGVGVVYARRDDIDVTYVVSELQYQRVRATLRGESEIDP